MGRDVLRLLGEEDDLSLAASEVLGRHLHEGFVLPRVLQQEEGAVVLCGDMRS